MFPPRSNLVHMTRAYRLKIRVIRGFLITGQMDPFGNLPMTLSIPYSKFYEMLDPL